MNCVCCGSSTSDSPYRDEFFNHFLQHCETCGHLQLKELPSESRLEEYYAHEYAAKRRALLNESYYRIMRKRAAAQISFIADQLSLDGLSVCDIGCGYGFLVEEFERISRDVCGLEYDPNAIEYCRLHGHRVDGQRSGRELLPDGEPDLVTLSHVLEHFVDPGAALERIGQVSRHTFIEVPVYDARLPEQFSAGEGHINFFTKHSLEHFLSRRGFDICRLDRYGPGMGLFWRRSMRLFRKPAQMVTGDYFMNHYRRLNPEGIWIRALITRRAARG